MLVIQQLFSNLLSALFIPIFKAMKDVGSTPLNEGDANMTDGSYQRPEYTFSFYILIVLHATATVCFATFNGRYLRYEHELDKKAQEEARKSERQNASFRQNQQQQHSSLPPMPYYASEKPPTSNITDPLLSSSSAQNQQPQHHPMPQVSSSSSAKPQQSNPPIV